MAAVTVKCKHGPAYTHCNESTPYPGRGNVSSQEVNDSLNLHLGLPKNPRDIIVLRKICKILSDVFSMFEVRAMNTLEMVPLRWRQLVGIKAWKLFLFFHKKLLHNRTGIHKDASLEYHALTSLMYWGRIFPTTIRRIRMSLDMLPMWHGYEIYPSISYKQLKDTTIETVDYTFRKEDLDMSIKKSSQSVTGLFIPHENSENVLFWLYGGAYLGGTSKGNVHFANKFAQHCKTNVFLPDYRLIPENHFFDALEDVIRSYEYLVKVRNVKPRNITLLGISSGGGLCVRLMQQIAELNLKEDMMPSGAVLMSPYVDYTDAKGSFKDYTVHDLFVNEAVFEVGIPYISQQGEGFAAKESPSQRSMKGLPPLCLVVSEHECCYDMNIELCNKARKAGVEVDLGIWKFMCHVWVMLPAFLPEARGAIEFVLDWVNRSQESASFDVDCIT